MNPYEKFIVREWSKLYHRESAQTWMDTWWFGARAEKLPADMWVYQEILIDVRPDVLIETGTMNGGSANFFATVFDLLGNGRVISIDIDDQGGRPIHDRITYVLGSSTDLQVKSELMSGIGPEESVMVVLDSDHARDHVLAELELWSEIVTAGSYLVVEDGNVNGHPVLPGYGPGPKEALDVWLPANSDFVVDRNREKFFHTFNPGGYLKKS